MHSVKNEIMGKQINDVVDYLNYIEILNQEYSATPFEYSGLGDTTVRSFGNRYSGIKETAIPVLETNHIVP